MQNLVIHLNVAQALQPNHSDELMRIVENPVVELTVLGIALDYGTKLKAHQLQQHYHEILTTRSMLQDVQK